MSELQNLGNSIKSAVKNWWILTILGVLFILLGIWVFRNPLESYVGLSLYFSIAMFIGGVFQIFFSISNKDILPGWGWQLMGGILQVLFGYVLTKNPQITMAILPFFVGFWLMFRSISLASFSLELRSFLLPNWWLYLLFAILIGIFSFFILTRPIIGGITIVTWTGMALILAGIAQIAISMDLKKLHSLAKKF